jgi:YHS domain-containing protein
MKLNVLISLTALLTYYTSSAQDVTQRTSHFNLNKSVALQGYDPVTYFSENKAIKGSKDVQVTHKGVTYYFSSSQSKASFEADPERYEPQYGGWCAYAMGTSGDKVKIDPETFKVVNGELFLFYNFYFNNTLKPWNKDEGELMSQADTNWNKIISLNTEKDSYK